jgi:hypothetical protein
MRYCFLWPTHARVPPLRGVEDGRVDDEVQLLRVQAGGDAVSGRVQPECPAARVLVAPPHAQAHVHTATPQKWAEIMGRQSK